MFIFFRKKKSLENKIDEILEVLNEKSLNKFIEIISSPKKLFWRNFIAGIAKGIGIAIGFSLLGAILIYLLRYIVMLNVPVIGAFLREIWEIMQNEN